MALAYSRLFAFGLGSVVIFVAHARGLQRKALIDDTVADSEVDLSSDDIANGRFVPNDQPIYVPDLYRQDKFEGDIAYPDDNTDPAAGTMPELKNDRSIHYNAVRRKSRRWPEGRIPYKISSRYTTYSRSRIAAAMQEYSKKTCIRFVPRKREKDYLYIFPDDGCYSLVGQVGGRQPLSLEQACIHKGIIMHELLHTVGFFHEQSRPDRDDYVDIIWDNVIPGADGQFERYPHRIVDNLGTKYDYSSIMHYSPFAFTRNGLPTVVPKRKGANIGQRKGFSRKDLYKIKKLYDCNRLKMKKLSKSVSSSSQQHESPIPCKDKSSLCRLLTSKGKCNRNSAFMSKNCRRSCRRCNE